MKKSVWKSDKPSVAKSAKLKGQSPNYKRHYPGKPQKTNNVREDFPMRLNRFLALRGIATRRDADEMIAAGRVFLRGEVAKLGDRVEHADEDIEIHEARFRENKEFQYVAYYKPRGIITHTPKGGEQDIRAVSGYPELSPLGRLDKDSEGLMLLTNDGRVTDRLLHPRFEHEKEYIVSVAEKVTGRHRDLLLRGIDSEGEKLRAKKVDILDPMTLSVVLTEGKKHQVRRMLEGVELSVTRLVRVRIMSIHLGKLSSGQARELQGPARRSFLREIGLK